MCWINLVIRFVRLGPLALGVIAVGLLVLGYYLQIWQNERAAEKALALRAGPPVAVDLTQFDRDQHMTDMREAVLQAQPVIEFAYRFTYERSGSDDYAYMVPLIAAEATSQTDIVGIALYHDDDFTHDHITPELFLDNVVDFGAFGPVINYNGEVKGLGDWSDLTRDAFREQGLDLPDPSVIIWPYIGGREAAFAPPQPGDWTVFGILSKIAGAIGLLAMLKLALRPDSGSSGPGTDASKADQPAYLAQPAAPQPSSYQMDNPIEGQARRGFGLRKVLIGRVGAAFLALLGVVIVAMMQENAAANDVPVAISADEQRAQVVAELVVPDADPNRHWTDIDVTPVLEWFVAKGLLAASGDTEAQLTLGLIIGGGCWLHCSCCAGSSLCAAP